LNFSFAYKHSSCPGTGPDLRRFQPSSSNRLGQQ
jgi:hypothetical protein